MVKCLCESPDSQQGLDPYTGEAHITGPSTKEEAKSCEALAALRDHLMILAVDAGKRQASSKDTSFEGTMALALLCNTLLPRRYQLSEQQQVHRVMDIERLSARERRRFLAKDFARLNDMQHDLPVLPPEIRQRIDRHCKRFELRRQHRKRGDGS